ncbi:MAG: hypothetical protein IKU07_01225, partial [Oscillospiraceae bacterium]|nr:hypothetical protein [Oscillospiraceae bacterium]
MKRVFSLLIALCLVISMFPAVQVFAAEPVTIYMDPKNGNNENDGTEDSPVQNFSTAYTFLQNGGGTIVMLSTVYYAGAVTLPACDYPVTIRAKNSADGIRTGSNFIISGETTFEHMTFTLTKASTGTVISGNGHKLIMGEELTMIPFENETDTYYFCLQGGSPSGVVESTDLTVLSGYYRNIYAGGYTKNVTGNSKLTMLGGTAAVVAAGYSGTMSGNVDMTFGGSATVTGTIYSGSWNKGDVGGDVTVTLCQGAKVNNLFAAGNGTGNMLGNVTMILDGYDNTVGIFKGTGYTSHTGTIGGSRLVLKSGKLTKAPTGFGSVDIDIPEGKILTLGVNCTADTLKAAGILHFSGAVKLTAKAVTGSVNCTLEGETLKNQAYITAPAGSAIAFPEGSGITENNGVWECRDLDAFAGLVLKADKNVKMSLYDGIWAQGTSTVYNVVTPYVTETKDGYNYYYYPNLLGGYHVRASRSGYITLYQNVYMSQEEAAAKTTEEITLDKKGTEGFVPSVMYSHTTEVLENEEAWKSEASMYPKYENALDLPVFESGRDPQQMTTQQELLADLAAEDKAGDNMYVYTLGKSQKGQDIPVVIFTKNNLSAANTLEEAAALMNDDRLTVYYRAQMHGNEPAGGEGALGMIHYMQDGYGAEILDRINLIIVPRLSPDGAELYQRLLVNSINPNRDQMRVESPEMQAFQKGYLLFDPEVVLDGHERVWNNSKGDIQVSTSFTPMTSDTFRTVALELDEAAFDELAANDLNGYYYAACVNEYDPNMGGGFYPLEGTFYVLMETRGIYGGNQSMERRAVAHIAAVTGMLDYLYEEASAVKATVAAERAAIAERGATYEDEDVFVLQTGSRTTTAADKEAWGYLNTTGQTIDWGSGAVTFPTNYPSVKDVVKRSRSLPTAYVIPTAAATEALLAQLKKHNISGYFLPEGATLYLESYAGTTTEATVNDEQAVRFTSGCYVIPMNTEKALLIAAFFEPDHTNSAEFSGNLAQMGLLSMQDTYRYARDLTEGGVDYTVTESEIVNITVYLDGTNGADTNSGKTEDTPVKTLEKAYLILENAMATASEYSRANLVILGLYDLGAKASHLPYADFPVTISGKTENDGFSYTGGTTQATQVFEIQGDTTFENIRLHIASNKAYNFFIANGYKLVLGEGIVNTAESGRYFTVVGGDYDYKDVNPSTDVTIRSGNWLTVYAGGYRGSVTGTAKLDISGATVQNNIAATYCGNMGSVEMTVANTTVVNASNYAIYMGPLDYSATYKTGAVLGDSVLTLGKNVSAAAVYGSARTNGHIYGDAVVILKGADLSGLPVLAKYAETMGTTAGHKMILGADIAESFTLDSAFTLDLAGHDITGNLTVNGSVTVYDSATDDYDVSDGKYGEITGAVNGTLVAKDGYIAAAGGFHKFGGQYISSVSLRPGNAGIYYTATFLADEVL